MKKKAKRPDQEITEKIDLKALADDSKVEALESKKDEDDFDLLSWEIDLSDDEDDPEKTAKLDLKEEDKKPKTKKPRKKRVKATKAKEDEKNPAESNSATPKKVAKSKRKTAAKKEDNDEQLMEETTNEEMPLEVVAQEKPKKKRKKRAASKIPLSTDRSPSHINLREDVSVTSVAMHKSMESMTKQWGSVKDLSDSISNNFERVGKQLHDVSESYEQSMKELSKIQAHTQAIKPSGMHKIAVGLAAFAFVLSLISLVFSQSVRTSHLATSQPIPVAKTPTPTYKAPAVAVAPPKKVIKKKRTKKRRQRRTRRRGKRRGR